MRTPDEDRWRRVMVQGNSQNPTCRSGLVGRVAADYARLLVADFDALGAWRHEDSLDGLADYVFWGRDAEIVAQALNAPRLSNTEFGWTNLPESLAEEHGIEVQKYMQRHGLKFATDYRPHSDHWQVMQTTRNSATESGTAVVGGVTVCNFMTTWGDGLFNVYRDLGESGELVQVRIELGGANGTG